ncbi:hypothetical protein OUZ56_025352 [Daphnia magna]|uniref:Uncharacterized protein n=1 Tax=Daphnia magna TaxID=35525 RepID=A0ABQ9ZJK8_9CRUS|nr:hypothetical protein OUZ56_025352 [Daphnia magna]
MAAVVFEWTIRCGRGVLFGLTLLLEKQLIEGPSLVSEWSLVSFGSAAGVVLDVTRYPAVQGLLMDKIHLLVCFYWLLLGIGKDDLLHG